MYDGRIFPEDTQWRFRSPHEYLGSEEFIWHLAQAAREGVAHVLKQHQFEIAHLPPSILVKLSRLRRIAFYGEPSDRVWKTSR